MLINRIKLIGFLCVIIIFGAFGCEKDEGGFPYGTCIKGKIVGFERCSGYVLIQVEGYDVGEKAAVPKFNDLGHIIEYIEYDNVIKAPPFGNLESPIGSIYFVARKYNPETDATPIIGCPPFIPYAVPIVVITAYSQIYCP